MYFRKADKNDLNALVSLQNQNSIILDPTMDRSDGSLASVFTVEDFAAINRDIAIVVSVNEADKLLGFVCSSTPDFNLKVGLSSSMISRFAQGQFDGKALSQWHCAIVGPVCVERNSRGQGIFEGLYTALWQFLPSQYEVAVALVSTENPRSLAAHKKLGMLQVDQFVYSGTTYDTIAMKVARR